MTEGQAAVTEPVRTEATSVDGVLLQVTDGRWRYRVPDPLLATGWFRAQTPATQARYCVARLGVTMALGIELEGLLARALCAYAERLPPGSETQRLVLEEVAEEQRHSAIFHTFVSWAASVVPEASLLAGSPKLLDRSWEARLRKVVSTPEVLYLLALCGEMAADALQRWYLCGLPEEQHPWLRAVLSGHVAEEAGHLRQATDALASAWPSLDVRRRNRLRYLAPAALRRSLELLVLPYPRLIRSFGVPPLALLELGAQLACERLTTIASRPVVETCWSVGIIDARSAPLWGRLSAIRSPAEVRPRPVQRHG